LLLQTSSRGEKKALFIRIRDYVVTKVAGGCKNLVLLVDKASQRTCFVVVESSSSQLKTQELVTLREVSIEEAFESNKEIL